MQVSYCLTTKINPRSYDEGVIVSWWHSAAQRQQRSLQTSNRTIQCGRLGFNLAYVAFWVHINIVYRIFSRIVCNTWSTKLRHFPRLNDHEDHFTQIYILCLRQTVIHKKFCYRRRTARRATSNLVDRCTTEGTSTKTTTTTTTTHVQRPLFQDNLNKPVTEG